MVRVGRLELPASCSQSKRATNCATPGYGIALSVAFHVVLVVFWPPALRKWFPLLVVSQRVVGLGFFPHGWAGYAPKSRALPTALHPDIQFFCMIPCGERKSKFFVFVGVDMIFDRLYVLPASTSYQVRSVHIAPTFFVDFFDSDHEWIHLWVQKTKISITGGKPTDTQTRQYLHRF